MEDNVEIVIDGNTRTISFGLAFPQQFGLKVEKNDPLTVDVVIDEKETLMGYSVFQGGEMVDVQIHEGLLRQAVLASLLVHDAKQSFEEEEGGF